MHTPTNNNTTTSNVMQNNNIKLIAHNYCMGETNYFNTSFSQSEELTPELFHQYKEQVNNPNKFMPADCEIQEFRLYTIRKDFLRTFLRESFGNLIRGIITASGDDQCLDYIPSTIDEYFSILQALLQSKDPTIRETIQDMDLALYGDIYDLYMQSFDPNNESDQNYIGTDILNWNQGLTENPEFPAIIL